MNKNSEHEDRNRNYPKQYRKKEDRGKMKTLSVNYETTLNSLIYM